MSRGGSDPVVERVREATDIVGLIGAQVELKRIGSRLRGLCPFHREKTPSFYVSPERQTYHCFGCGESGDCYSYVMAQDRMTFPEALRHLAERAGITLPDRRGPSGDALDRLREALKLARTFYRARLLSPQGAAARAYLERRGIHVEVAERYQLGVSPDAWDGLLIEAKRVISERTVIEAGLAVENDRGRVYDRFRNRLMIPIQSASGAPLGFGGRSLGDEEPKYLNSPETAVYRKGSVLFGVAEARTGLREEGRVVVVEGYFDVIALSQGGIGGVVGSCGTALTEDQALGLRRLGERVVLLFDGDSAGKRAALRALPLVVGVVDRVQVAFPPEGLDPDDWVRRDGAEAVRARLVEARAPLAFLEDQVSNGVMTRKEAAERTAELLQHIQDPITRDLWVQEASERFGVRREAFLERLKQPAARPGTAAFPRPAAAPETPWSRGEAQCLLSALAHPFHAGELAGALEALGAASRILPLLRWIAELASEGAAPAQAEILTRAAAEREEGRRLNALALQTEGPVPSPAELLAKLEAERILRRMKEVSRLIRRAEETSQQGDLSRLLAEKQELTRARARARTAISGE